MLRRILPGLRHVPADQIRELPDEDAVWLWNSQPISGDPVQIGASVDLGRLAEIPLGEPLRLVRIERDLWTQALEQDLPSSEEAHVPDDGVGAMIATPTFCPHQKAISNWLSMNLLLAGASAFRR